MQKNKLLLISALHAPDTRPLPQVAEVAEDGGRHGRGDGERQADAELLHAQLAGDAREVVADGAADGEHDERKEEVQHAVHFLDVIRR